MYTHTHAINTSSWLAQQKINQLDIADQTGDLQCMQHSVYVCRQVEPLHRYVTLKKMYVPFALKSSKLSIKWCQAFVSIDKVLVLCV